MKKPKARFWFWAQIQRAIEFAQKNSILRPGARNCRAWFCRRLLAGHGRFSPLRFPSGLPIFPNWNPIYGQFVDEVAMFFPLRSFYEHASRVAALCQQHGIMLRFDPDVFRSQSTHWNAKNRRARITCAPKPTTVFAMVIKARD